MPRDRIFAAGFFFGCFLQQAQNIKDIEIYLGLGLLITSLLAVGCLTFQFMACIQVLGTDMPFTVINGHGLKV